MMGRLLLCGLLGCLAALPCEAAVRHGFEVLVFSRTEGFRHDSIADGLAMLERLALAHEFEVTATEDAGAFTEANLAGYDVVVFLSTTGDVLNAEQQAAFERYIQTGGAFVGIHAASDTEYQWPWYGGLVGAYFESHPPGTEEAEVQVLDPAHPSTADLPRRWLRTDEWYNFTRNPRGDVHVLARLNEATLTGGTMGGDHPISWCQPYNGGRSWYTALGHTRASYTEPLFEAHVLGGLEWAAGVVEGDCGATLGANFEKATLDGDVANPMDLAVMPDGRVVFIERAGLVKIYDPATGQTLSAGLLDVTTRQEDGLLGVELDPDFSTNGWLYLYYAVDTAPGEPEVQRLSRFSMVGNALDRSSEVPLLEVPVQRDQCCHSGGSMAFDADGNLYLSTGDNTNPFASDGYAPIDERAGRSAWDAQKSSGNTNDLRGKILRITPQADGSYTIPAGNLFAPGVPDTRPEIYVMGARNPFRISVDPATNWLYWGEVGPDARDASAARGPAGLDEWNQTRAAGNYGWPYCSGPNLAYHDYDFATGTAGAPFDCEAPTNTSPNNTGLTTLPPATPAWIWYPYGASEAFPGVTGGDGRTAMAGPVYHHEAAQDGDRRLPAYYDDTLFIYEWSRNWIHEVKLDDDGDLLAILPFMPEHTFNRPIAMELGPDGALYLLEWGSGFGGDNSDARLARLSYQTGSQAPVVSAEVGPTSGALPLTVQFDAAASYDPDPGEALTFSWDLDGDGTPDAEGRRTQFTYTEAGTYAATLRVTDSAGNEATASWTIVAGNTMPLVVITAPVAGGFFDWGDTIPFTVTVDDAEDGSTADGTIACDAVVVQAIAGHDTHGHPLEQVRSCEGAFIAEEESGAEGENLFYVLEASYTDGGGAGPGALTARTDHILQPRHKGAEHFTRNGGVELEETGDVRGGGQNLGYIDHGDYVAYEPMNLAGIGFVTFRVASAGPGGRIEVRVDAPDGPLLGTAYVEPTGGWQTYTDVTAALDAWDGPFALHLVFLDEPGSSGLFNVNDLYFHGSGIAVPPDEPRGLTARYYPNRDFSGRVQERTDPVINFNWGDGSPMAFIGRDDFSVRWTGFVEPPRSGAYRFYARADDGIRVWLDGDPIIDRWEDAAGEGRSPSVELEVGRRYALQVDYFDATGRAEAHLLWQGPSTPKAVIPGRYLFLGETSTAAEPLPEGAAALTLEAAYPNPAASQIRSAFVLPTPGAVRLDVYDLLGRRIATLADGWFAAGRHDVAFETQAVPSGTYVLRLVAPGVGTRVRSLVVMR